MGSGQLQAKVAVIVHLDEKIYPLPAPLHSALFRNIILTSAIGLEKVTIDGIVGKNKNGYKNIEQE
jgi:hypothetical protein